MSEPILLYSAITSLAYQIAEAYYGDRHYVWCNRYFSARSVTSASGRTPPPTSLPFEIYHNLLREVQAGDRHSAKIAENKTGITRGASIKLTQQQITREQEREIHDIVQTAQISDFEPLMLIIPYMMVQPMVKVVPVGERANPLWIEYRIEALPRDCFDIIPLTR